MTILFIYIYIIIFSYFLSYLKKNYSFLEKSYTCNYKSNSNINNEIIIYFSNLIAKNKIMLIGVSNPYHNYKLNCGLIYKKYNATCNITVKKIFTSFHIKLHINLTYIALYINLNSKAAIPTFLKINNKKIPLLFYKPKNKYNIILGIANFYNIRNYKQVLEVIEISKLYGVEHIVIYVSSSTLFIKSILFYYLKSKYVELIPFCLNSEIKFVHQKGQIEKINDLLYRYMYNTKYIIFNDIDEIILPIKTNNYMQFFSNIDNHSSDMYLFKSKLFPYYSKDYKSIINYKDCCIIKNGWEKFIVGKLYKYEILSVHNHLKSFSPIKINVINHSYGYVRHTRRNGTMCRTNLIDISLNYLDTYLTKIYKKFEIMFNYNSDIYHYGNY